MNIFVARQPIFDERERVYSYELLFRSSLENVFSCNDGDQASSNVISDSMLVFGLDSLTNGRRAFINVTRRLLVEELATILPPEKVVLEILETVQPDAEVIAACQGLKQAGYLLALDDFVLSPEWEALVPLADIIKIDFLATGAQQRGSLADVLSPHGTRLLAEKVETRQDFLQAKELGYCYFQGYFFSRPEIVSGTDIPTFKLHYLHLLREVNRPQIDFDCLSRIVKSEVSLSVKLLRYINSCAFGFRCRVSSIKHAIVLLGERPFRKWASLVAIACMCEDKPPELLILCLVRACFCEQLSAPADLSDRTFELFLTGMLSGVAAILDRPLSEVLDQIAVSWEVRAALLDGDGRLGAVYGLVLAYERGNWERVAELTEQLRIDETSLPPLYHHAVEWAAEIFHVGAAQVSHR